MENSRRAKLLKNASVPRVRYNVQDNTSSGAYFHGDGSEDVDMGPVVFENAKKVFVRKLVLPFDILITI